MCTVYSVCCAYGTHTPTLTHRIQCMVSQRNTAQHSQSLLSIFLSLYIYKLLHSHKYKKQNKKEKKNGEQIKNTKDVFVRFIFLLSNSPFFSSLRRFFFISLLPWILFILAIRIFCVCMCDVLEFTVHTVTVKKKKSLCIYEMAFVLHMRRTHIALNVVESVYARLCESM